MGVVSLRKNSSGKLIADSCQASKVPTVHKAQFGIYRFFLKKNLHTKLARDIKIYIFFSNLERYDIWMSSDRMPFPSDVIRRNA